MILIFAGLYYYPRGGAEDLVGMVDEPNYLAWIEVHRILNLEDQGDKQWAHAFDTDKGKIVKVWNRDAAWQTLDGMSGPWEEQEVETLAREKINE